MAPRDPRTRFAEKTSPGPLHPVLGPCLQWTGAVKKPSRRPRYNGGRELPHGKFWLEGRVEYAHRVALALHMGVKPGSLGLVAHECDNPKCVNPLHLAESTHGANLADSYARGRRAKDEDPHGVGDWFLDQGAAYAAADSNAPEARE